MKKRTVLGVILERILGLLFFLVLLVIANILESYISNTIYSQVIAFLNNNLGLIILFSVILFFGELFSVFKFPFNFPYPIFNAIGSIFLVTFLFRIVYLVKEIISPGLVLPFRLLELLIFPLVFLIVLIVGYVRIFTDLSKPRKQEKKVKKKIDWKDKVKEVIEDINDFMNKINKALFAKKGK